MSSAAATAPTWRPATATCPRTAAYNKWRRPNAPTAEPSADAVVIERVFVLLPVVETQPRRRHWHAAARLLGDFLGVFRRIFAEIVVEIVLDIIVGIIAEIIAELVVVPNISVAPPLTATSTAPIPAPSAAAAAMIVSDSARGGGGALIDRLSAKYRRVFDGARGCAEGSAPRE